MLGPLPILLNALEDNIRRGRDFASWGWWQLILSCISPSAIQDEGCGRCRFVNALFLLLLCCFVVHNVTLARDRENCFEGY